MKKWKILFIGVGSIAKRHIRNVNTFIKSIKNECQIDVFRTRVGCDLDEEICKLVTSVYFEVKLVPADYDIIFITNPTQLHFETLLKFMDHGKNFFIEKPFCTVQQIPQIAMNLKKDSVYYVASPLRYHPVIQYIRKNIDLNSVFSVQCISSSYLPDWRPGTDYTKTYSAHKDLGGGVSIDLIHEWDYITYLFGMPKGVKSFICHKSDLKIDSDDLAIYIAEYEKMTVEIHVDYIGREPLRKLSLIMKEDTVICDLLQGTICYLKENKTIKLKCDRDTYQVAELEHFWGLIRDEKYGAENMMHAINVLKIAGGIWRE